jgi:molybdenum cofactor guanylyltransferase
MGGGDKPLLEVRGQPMLARIVASLAADHDRIAISANGDPARFAAFRLPVLSDGPFLGQGPLAGLLAGLSWAAELKAEALLSVPGDTPFLPSALALLLGPPPAFLEADGMRHYLVALWPVAARDQLHHFLSAPGPRAVAYFGQMIGARAVRLTGQSPHRFLNVNTPADLESARAIAELE